ncbi:uncharacterized protein LOC114280029 [Camellia sinensis]|uniref:uncharacterized protein LOC114280029 n=1 Tax=Camellia sinensis TaxID=4442 RepID=UPI0010366BD3|nr:uncharacterized protein LOC114280029 [Camellia sinensis]
MLESLACEKWSCFSNNQYLEEAKKSSKPGLVAQRKAYFEALYNRNGAKKPAALLEEQNAACNEPNVMEETSRDSSNPPRIPTRASANRLSVHSPTAPQEERRRSKPVDDCSVSRRRIADGKSHGIDHLKTSGVSGPKARRPTVPSPFNLRCEDRAAKRKEFFRKLEEKTNAKILVSGRRIADGKSHGIDHLKTSGVSGPKAQPPTVPSSFSLRCEERAAKRKEFFQKLEEKTNAKEANKVYLQAKNKISLTQPMQVKMKLVNLGHAQSEETRMKIGNGVRMGWERRREKLKLQETCYFEWQNLIAEASRKGFVGEEEKQWDSYEILDEQLEQEWLESVEQSRKMARPKGSKRAPNSLEQRRKISEAISAKWAETCYFEWQNLIAEASRKGFVGEEEKQWDSYEILDEQLEQEWLESVEQSRKMARPKGSKRAPNSLEQRRKISEAISAKWAETCYFEWQNLIAEASRKGFVGEEEKQWDSYEILDEQLEQEWLESVEQSRKMARPKGSKRAPNSLEQRRKISEAISAKWAETCYFEWQNLIAEASRKGFVGEEEKQWDSYEILDEQLEQEWLESVEQSRKMARPKGSKRAPNSLEQRRKISEAISAKWAETCYFEWQNLIAEASRKGFVGEEEKQWDSYEILDEQLEQEWLESVEQSRKMARPKGSKRAPNSLEQRRKISEAISAKWAETCYFEWQNLIAEASRKGFVGEEEKQWDSYEILDEQLEQEWLESVEQSRKMARPKGSKRAPNSLEQRRKISEAISAKWAETKHGLLSKFYLFPLGIP